MKKLLSLLLIISLLIPVFAFADDPDPIVGCWYVCLDTKDTTQEFVDQGYVFSTMVFAFTSDGSILAQSTDYKINSGESKGVYVIGKWEKSNGEYQTSVYAVGVNEAKVDSEMMAACLLSNGQYIILRRMVLFNPYTEIYRK